MKKDDGSTKIIIVVVLIIIVGISAIVGLAPQESGRSTENPAQETVNSVLAVATQNDSTTTFAAALNADAELTSLLSSTEGFYTLLTPLNAALPDDEVTPELLRNHIINDELNIADLRNLRGKTVTTLQGKKLKVSVDKDDNVKIANVRILQTDSTAINGVVHVMEKTIE